MGTAGARGWGVERIHVVDDLLARRFRRALWSHTLRAVRVLRLVLAVFVVATGCAVGALSAGWVHPTGAAGSAWWLVGAAGGAGLATYAVAVLVWMRRHEAWLGREVVPGRFIAVTVGQESIRVRDHDSSVEYGYSLITGVHQYDDVVVLEHSPSLWTLPLEVFEVHELSVIRARAGRRFLPSQGTTEQPLEVGPIAVRLARSQRSGRVVR